MVNAIMEAVSVALDAEFGEGYEYHIEEVSQDMDGHTFIIQCLDHTDEPFRGQKYFSRNHFGIKYYPQSEDDKDRECHEVMGRMDSCLEYIDVDGLMMGTKMNGQVAGGILYYFVNYDYFAYKREGESPEMGEMVSHMAVKEGG